MITRRSIPILAIAALSLGACAKDAGEYPSLGRRPAERVTGTLPVETPATQTPAPTDPATLGTLDSLLAKARKGHDLFQSKEARTRGLVSAASGAPVASESWSVATVALSDLSSARSDLMVAMADLDALYARAVVDGKPAGDIAGARNTVQGLLNQEDKVLAALRASLR